MAAWWNAEILHTSSFAHVFCGHWLWDVGGSANNDSCLLEQGARNCHRVNLKLNLGKYERQFFLYTFIHSNNGTFF